MANSKTNNKRHVMRSATSVVKKFNASWDYAEQNHHDRWNRNWKLYNNKRHSPSYQGITNTFVPMSFSTVETLTAALCAGKPSVDFSPQDMYKYIQSYITNGKKPDLKALNAQYDYYWDCDNWDLKTIKTVRSGFITGTACEWVYWDGDKPRIINMHPRDAIIDPSLVDPMQLWTNPNDFYTGRRYHTTKAKLAEEQIVDPETGDLKPRFKNLDKITSGSADEGDETAKQLKEKMMLGSPAADEDTIEVIELVTGDKITSVANRTATIEDRDNDLGIHFLAIHRFIADENMIYGKSILDPIAASQELLNDVTNQRTDAVTEMLLPEREIDPAYASWIPKIKSGLPGTIYPFKPGTMQIIQKQQTNFNAFQETTNIKNEMREATGADQVVKGVAQDQQTTATEIKAQMNQAGERFGIYVRMLEREGLYQRTKIVYRMMLAYVTDKQLVPVNSMDGPKFRDFNPKEFDDTYEPQIRLEASVQASKQMDAKQATESYSILIQDPTNDLWEAKKILYPKMFDLSEEELDRIIGTEKPVQPDPLTRGAPGEEAPAEEQNPLAGILGGAEGAVPPQPEPVPAV